jgi:hypothetical protein
MVAGPAIVERMGDTIVIPPDCTAEVDRYRNLILHLKGTPGGRPAVGQRGALA